MRTYIYVDGFNLYNRALKNTPHKWLDLKKLCEIELASYNQIEVIKYFTSPVKARTDPDQYIRQHTYLRALDTLGIVQVYYGKFLSKAIRRPPVSPPPAFVDVMSTQEKGSDVNLASHLLYDGFRNAFEVAVVISNDTDLREPIRLAVQEMGKVVGVMLPEPAASGGLTSVASFVRNITRARLAASQFPGVLYSRKGKPIRKPPIWSHPKGRPPQPHEVGSGFHSPE
jgi:uncharacterized LabA/DUF88 family protein